jgi:hypothetical protein
MEKIYFNSQNIKMPTNGNFTNSRKILPSESKNSKTIPWLIAKSTLMRTA